MSKQETFKKISKTFELFITIIGNKCIVEIFGAVNIFCNHNSNDKNYNLYRIINLF